MEKREGGMEPGKREKRRIGGKGGGHRKRKKGDVKREF